MNYFRQLYEIKNFGRYYIEYAFTDERGHINYRETTPYLIKSIALKKGKFEIFKTIARYPNSELYYYKLIRNGHYYRCDIPLYKNFEEALYQEIIYPGESIYQNI
jgi:hypothetical protein